MISSKAGKIVDPLPTHREWERLSVVPEKRDAYSKDLYFRACWATMTEVFGAHSIGMLHSLAVMNMKPDAVVGRRMARALEFVVGWGFLPIAAAPLQLTRHSMRELWRYDWDVHPLDRLAFSTFWYTSAETPVFVLQDVRPQGSIPASVRLSQMKGSAAPEKRGPGDLRTLLSPPNRILNFVHVAEEPADVVRELGIFFDRAERRTFLNEIKNNVGVDRRGRMMDEIARLEARHREHDLDFFASVRRFEESAAVRREVAEYLRMLFRGGEKLSWDDLCSIVDPAAEKVDRWDFICVASNLIRFEREVYEGTFPSVAVDKWKSLAAEPAEMLATISTAG